MSPTFQERSMKYATGLIAVVVAMTSLAGHGRADDGREGKPRMKGVELWSWKDKDDKWTFVLLNGTNANKSKARIKGADDQIKSIADLRKAMSRLAVDEHVFWHHRTKGFAFPPEATREEIREFAKQARLQLHIVTPK
jgi:hypothetical protein